MCIVVKCALLYSYWNKSHMEFVIISVGEWNPQITWRIKSRPQHLRRKFDYSPCTSSSCWFIDRKINKIPRTKWLGLAPATGVMTLNLLTYRNYKLLSVNNFQIWLSLINNDFNTSKITFPMRLFSLIHEINETYSSTWPAAILDVSTD